MAQQKRENYFEMNLRDHDENFINTRSPQDLQRDARKRIFKDMIFGNIDYERFGSYFTIPNFIEALITVANVEAQKHSITAIALEQYYATTCDPVAYAMFIQHKNCAYILECIRYDLEAVKNNNYDITPLTQLQIQLASVPTCKKDYNEFY